MNLRQVSLVMLCIVLSIQFLYCQSVEYIKPQVINYNYENKLRFEWPVNFQSWKKSGYYKSILYTQKYIKIIQNNLEEISFEAKTGDPLHLKIYQNGQKTHLDIAKSNRPVSYQYKDSLLLFTGLHVIELISPDQEAILLYFDKAEDLKLMEGISFDKIYEGIQIDLNKRKIFSNRDLRAATEILYQQKGEDLVNTGIQKENANFRYGLGVVLGGIVAPGDVGITSLTDFSRIKYTINSFGQSQIKSKTSFNLGYNLLGKNDMITLGFSYVAKPINPRFHEHIKFLGIGLGMVANSQGTSSKTGAYLSFILEKNHFYLNQSFNVPLQNKPWVNWSYATLTVGFRI